MTPPDNSSDDVTAFRLAGVEQAVRDLRRDVHDRFNEVAVSIGTLNFVSKDVYMSERESMRRDIESTHRLAQWAVGLVASTTIGAIIVAILGLSGVFGS